VATHVRPQITEMVKYVCEVELTWPIIIVVIIKIHVIKNSGDMCVVQGLHLATSTKSPNGLSL
jgi:hypothetical protein